jgi:outer membrane protein OmpA-like peptidoglycan-associated protein
LLVEGCTNFIFNYRQKMKRLFFYQIILGLAVFDAFVTYSQCPEGFQITQTNLIYNGDFSLGNDGFETDYAFTPAKGAVRPGGYVIGDDPYFHNVYFEFDGKLKSEGMIVDGNNNSSMVVWSQRLVVKPNSVYAFTISLLTLRPENTPALTVTIGKSRYRFTSGNMLHWKKVNALYHSKKDSLITMTIVDNVIESAGNDFILDNLKLCECEKIEIISEPLGKVEERADQPPPIKKEIRQVRRENQEPPNHAVVAYEEGEKIELKINFERSDYNLLPESFETLDQLAKYLLDNPDKKLVLEGHTDNVGNPLLNIELSTKRVMEVKRYLVEKGVSENRIAGKGYGGERPVAGNEIEETRKLNRRVEMVITSE